MEGEKRTDINEKLSSQATIKHKLSADLHTEGRIHLQLVQVEMLFQCCRDYWKKDMDTVIFAADLIANKAENGCK